MIIFGTHLAAALLAGLAHWIVNLICVRLGLPAWLTTILTGATLVYVFWLLLEIGGITIGR